MAITRHGGNSQIPLFECTNRRNQKAIEQAGVYIIQNKIDGKVYIGASRNIYSRLCDHKTALRGNYHVNKHLLSAYNKHGEYNFSFEVLEHCNEEYIYSQENYWCNMLLSHDRKHGYNIDPTSPIGKTTVSAETRQKMSDGAAKRKVMVYTIYGQHYQTFSDFYKCAEHFNIVAPNVHRKMNNILPKKYLIDSKSSRYVFTDKPELMIQVKEHWERIFKSIQNSTGDYLVYDCFDNFIGISSAIELSAILDVSVRSIYSSEKRGTYLKGLKMIKHEGCNNGH